MCFVRGYTSVSLCVSLLGVIEQDLVLALDGYTVKICGSNSLRD